MPSHNASGRVITYGALPPVKEQQKFSHRRRSVRTRSTALRPNRDQSTLTQFDFSSTPSADGAHASNTTDDDDDRDFAETRPKKRQRTIKTEGKNVRQKTLTQIDRSGGYSGAMKRQIDSQGWQVWDESDDETSMHATEHRKRWSQIASPALERPGCPAEIPESSQIGCKPSPEIGEDSVPQGRRPLLVFQTPKKSRFADEIPSSQTPPSTRRSCHDRTRVDGANQRSPLKEKSVNALMHNSRDSQPETMKILERARLARRNIAARQHLAENMSILDEIPDDGDALLEDSLEDAVRDAVGLGLSTVHSVKSTPHRSKKQVVIQDSQSETLSEWADCEAAAPDLHDGSSVKRWPESQPHTYDPAYDALARDAGRFGLTQTPNHQRTIEPSCEFSDDDDLDRGCLTRPDGLVDKGLTVGKRLSANRIPSSSPPKAGDSAQSCPGAGQDGLSSRHRRATRSEGVDGSVDSGVEATTMPSSPSTPGPSQATTVVPSQRHTLAPNGSCSRRSGPTRSLQLAQPSLGLTLDADPWAPSQRHSSQQHIQLVSSSPLQRPSWATQDLAAFTQTSTRRRGSRESEPTPTKLERLLDFSLPPPPALSSSRRHTPSSSS